MKQVGIHYLNIIIITVIYIYTNNFFFRIIAGSVKLVRSLQPRSLSRMKAVWGFSNNGDSTSPTKIRQDLGLLQEKPRLGFLQPNFCSSHVVFGRTTNAPVEVGKVSVDVEKNVTASVYRKQNIGDKDERSTIQDEKIVINVRGRLYETFVETLERFPNTLLGCSETLQVYYEMDKQQYCFGRRNVSSFDAILFFYQSNGILSRPADVDSQTFYNEIRFFQLDEDVVQNFLESEGLKMESNHEIEKLPGGEVWKNLEYPSYSTFAQMFACSSLLVICLSIVIFCGETLPSIRQSSERKSIFNILEIFSITWFTLEYLLRLSFSPNRKQFCLSAIGCIDVLAIVPFFVTTIMASSNFDSNHGKLCCILRVLKLLRVLRVLKFSRYVQGMKVLGQTLVKSAKELVLLFLCLLIASVFFASLAYITDYSDADSQVASIPDGIWFSIITLTTIGYGDVIPITELGKVNAIFCMLAGVVVLSIPVPVIVANFTTLYRMRKNI